MDTDNVAKMSVGCNNKSVIRKERGKGNDSDSW